MAEILFPFDKIKKDSKIVIYGMGFVGKQYLAQVQALEYCHVVALIDRNASLFAGTPYYVETLDSLEKYTYDYIVISVLFEDTARSIMADIQQKIDVPKEKFVFGRAGQGFSMYGLADMLKGYAELSDCLEDFLTKAKGRMDFFVDAIIEFRTNLYLSPEVFSSQKNFFMDYLHQEISVKKKIILLRFLYEAECFDKECAELFMHSIEDIKDNFDARMWLLWELSNMELHYQSIRYDNFFLDERRIIRENIEHYVGKNRYVKGTASKNGKRLALIATCCPVPRLPNFRMLLPVANEMKKMGCQVRIFPIDLFRYSYGECFIEPFWPRVEKSELSEEDFKAVLEAGIEMLYPKGATIQERIEHFATNLYDYNPDIVYDFSGSYPFCSPIYFDAFPTVYLPMRGCSTGAWFDKYVARDKELCREENEIFHSILPEQLEAALPAYTDRKNELPPEPYERKEYGFDPGDFLIVTSGRRLQADLSIEFIDCVCSFLIQYPDTKWILVSNSTRDYIKVRYGSLLQERKIIEWGYEPELSRLYGMCDIYWSPERNGSAGCVNEAMQCGLPVVLTTFPSDILPHIGKENAIEGGYAKCKEYVEQLYSDKELYKQKSQLMKERYNAFIHGEGDYARKLLEIGSRINKR